MYIYIHTCYRPIHILFDQSIEFHIYFRTNKPHHREKTSSVTSHQTYTVTLTVSTIFNCDVLGD